jgi:hypothetical protein
MEKVRRTIFFWTLVVLFFIVAPSIVLNAWGYSFDLHRGIFVHSGTLSIKANPQNFNVSVDGTPASSKQLNRINSSYNITDLFPRQHTVTLSADGYQSWEKTLNIHSGMATEFWNVILAKNNYTRTPYNTGGTDKFFISPKNDFIAFEHVTDSDTNVGILRLSDKTITKNLSFSGWKFTDEFRRENIEWSPNGDYILVPVKKTTANPAMTAATIKQKNSPQPDITKYNYFVADPNSASDNGFSLNDFTGITDMHDVRWDPQNKNYVFFISDNSLYRANILDKSEIIKIAENVSSFDLSRSAVYYSQMPNELVFKTSFDGKDSPSQITNTFPEQVATPNDKLIIYDESRIAFLNSNKDLFIYNQGELDNYFRKLGSNISGMQFSDDGKKLLFWTDNAISVYFLRSWNVQPERSENEIQNITRYSEPLRNIQWFKDYEHVIFSTGPYVKIIELDARDHRISMDLLKTDNESPFVIYNGALENLFFADSQNHSSDLYSIVFPEPTGFLGILPAPANP